MLLGPDLLVGSHGKDHGSLQERMLREMCWHLCFCHCGVGRGVGVLSRTFFGSNISKSFVLAFSSSLYRIERSRMRREFCCKLHMDI